MSLTLKKGKGLQKQKQEHKQAISQSMLVLSRKVHKDKLHHTWHRKGNGHGSLLSVGHQGRLDDHKGRPDW